MSTSEGPVKRQSVHTMVFRSLKRTHEMFLSDEGNLPELDEKARKLWLAVKAKDQYGPVLNAVKLAKDNKDKQELNLPKPPPPINIDPKTGAVSYQQQSRLMITAGPGVRTKQVAGPPQESSAPPPKSTALASVAPSSEPESDSVKAMLPRRAPMMVKPQWHPPWKLYRVVSGHTGWVRCVDVEPGNEWFCTGASDRIIKIWDLASGKLRLSLTGHVSAVRGVKVSKRHPYLYSVGEDKQVKCWDLEYNKVIRHYHGHLSGIYALDLHPTIDVLVTAGRDATARVWDMRTKAQVHCLAGHSNTVGTVVCQESEPQILTGSHDSTIRLWDLGTGKSLVTLTHHKKSVRSLCLHPTLYMFASGSTDNIKQWKCPNGEFIQNLTGHNSIINSICVNQDGVLVSGGDNGSLQFWDWKTGFCFQKLTSKPQPGSIESENGIYALTFDQSSSRMISCEADKTIKLYKEDEEATEESHPILWRPEILKRKQY